ncbi:MAG: TIM barrel protein [Spirochaetaceae bacterium]|nr:TIM barrel protein [Spirochaetaceae bacterium]
MEVGYLSAILPEYNFEQVMNFAKTSGFKHVELACWPVGKAERRYAGVSHLDVSTLKESIKRDILNIISSTVPVSALAYYPNVLADDESQSLPAIEHLKQLIIAASFLGISRVNTFIGREHSRDVEYNFGRFKEVWPDIIQFAEQHRVRICIENCPMYFSSDEWPGGKNLATTPNMWDRMFTEIPSDSFGLNYDPSHMVWQQMDYIQPLYDFSEKLFQIHIKDLKILKHKLNKVGIMAHPLEYCSPKLPGLGDIDWSAFFSALNSIGYDGPAIIEVEDKAYEGSDDDVLASLHQSLRYVKQFVS